MRWLIIILVVAVVLGLVVLERRRNARRRGSWTAGSHDPGRTAPPPGDGFTPTNNQWM
jgi:hypothetical protein